MTKAKAVEVQPILPSIDAMTDEQAQNALTDLRVAVYNVVYSRYSDYTSSDEKRKAGRVLFRLDRTQFEYGGYPVAGSVPWANAPKTSAQVQVTLNLTRDGSLDEAAIREWLTSGDLVRRLTRDTRTVAATPDSAPQVSSVQVEGDYPKDENPKQAYSDFCRACLSLATEWQNDHGWCGTAREVWNSLNIPADVFGSVEQPQPDAVLVMRVPVTWTDGAVNDDGTIGGYTREQLADNVRAYLGGLSLGTLVRYAKRSGNDGSFFAGTQDTPGVINANGYAYPMVTIEDAPSAPQAAQNGTADTEGAQA